MCWTENDYLIYEPILKIKDFILIILIPEDNTSIKRTYSVSKYNDEFIQGSVV